jgi:hypothetical protein
MGEFPDIFISNVPQGPDLRVRLLARFQSWVDVAPVYSNPSIGDAAPLGGHLDTLEVRPTTRAFLFWLNNRSHHEEFIRLYDGSRFNGHTLRMRLNIGHEPYVVRHHIRPRPDLENALLDLQHARNEIGVWTKRFDAIQRRLSDADEEKDCLRRRIRELERELEKERTRASPAEVLAVQQGPQYGDIGFRQHLVDSGVPLRG